MERGNELLFITEYNEKFSVNTTSIGDGGGKNG